MFAVSKLNTILCVMWIVPFWGCSSLDRPAILETRAEFQRESANGIQYIQRGGGPKVVLLFNSEGEHSAPPTSTSHSEAEVLIDRLARNAEVWAVDTAQERLKKTSLTTTVEEIQRVLQASAVYNYHLITFAETAAIGSVLASSGASVLSVSMIAPIFYDNSDDDLPLSLSSRESRRALERIHQQLETEEDSKTLLRSIEKFKLSTVPKILFYSDKATTVDQTMAQNFRSTFNRIQIIDVSDKNLKEPLSINKIAARITTDLSKSH